MKKRNRYLLIGIFAFILIAGIISVNALFTRGLIWEPANHIKIKFGTQTDTTLDSAITSGLLINDRNSPLTVSSGTLPSLGHNASEIWISIKENGVRKEMLLKDAFSSARNLCGDTDFSGYTNSPSPSTKYHLATQVEVATGKSLQDAINAKELLYTNNYGVACTGSKLYFADSCNRPSTNLKTDCGVDGSVHGPYTFQCSSNQIIASGMYDHNGCSNNACFSTPTPGTVTIACYSGYTCVNGDTSGDCATSWISQYASFQTPPGGNVFVACAGVVPKDTCDGNLLSSSSCPVNFTGTCSDIIHTDTADATYGCYPTFRGGGGRSNWVIRTLQCNSLN